MPVLKGSESDSKAPARPPEAHPFTGVQFEVSKSGRAKCKVPTCRDKIPEGDYRVGIETFSSGRFVVGWLHPKCFLQNIRVDVAENKRGKCKDTWNNCLVGHVSATVIPDVIAKDADFNVHDIAGMSDLSSPDRATMLAALARAGHSPQESAQAGGAKTLASKTGGCKTLASKSGGSTGESVQAAKRGHAESQNPAKAKKKQRV